MEQKNIDTILETMAEKIRDLEFELGLRQYEVDKCKDEINKLIQENEGLRANISRLAEEIALMECGKEAEDGVL